MSLNRKFLPIAALVSASLMLGACSKDDSDGGTDVGLPTPGTPTTITTAAEGAKVAKMVENSIDPQGEQGDIQTDLTDALGDMSTFAPGLSIDANKLTPQAAEAVIALGKMLDGPAAAAAPLMQGQGAASLATQTEALQCDSGSGSITLTDNTDASGYGTFSISLATANCVMGNTATTASVMNGSMSVTMTSTASPASVTLVVQSGDGDGALEEGDFTLTTYSGGTMSAKSQNSMKMTMTLDGVDDPAMTSLNVKIVGNGVNKVEDFVYPEVDETLMDNFSLTMSVDSASSNKLTMTLNGASEEKYDDLTDDTNDYTQLTSFNNLVMTVLADAATSTTFETIDGLVLHDETPDSCGEGTYKFVTNLPVKTVSGTTVEGQITINDNVTLVYNNDGSVTVTVDGASTIYNSGDFTNACLL